METFKAHSVTQIVSFATALTTGATGSWPDRGALGCTRQTVGHLGCTRQTVGHSGVLADVTTAGRTEVTEGQPLLYVDDVSPVAAPLAPD